MITRRIGKLIRGKATPFQVFSAGLLGAFLAFTPGFSQAPALILFWFFLLAVLNANLFVAALVGAGAKILALLLTPVSFAVGRVLLEGPTEGLFRAVVNAPVLAFFGFDYYVVAGGQLIGLIVGAGAGWLLAGMLTRFRKQLSQMEAGSERFQKWNSKKTVRFATYIFVGGKRKKSYEELMAKRVGNPIRPIGVILVILMVVVIYVGLQFFQGPIVTAALRAGLEKANGATVDLAEADLDPTAGKLTVTGLALANSTALDTDVFRTDRVEADISLADILRRRAVLDRVVIDRASSGEKRKVPGQLIGPQPKPPRDKIELPDMESLENVLDNAKVWKERLSQVRKWLDSLGGGGDEDDSQPGSPGFQEQLEARVRSLGHANVRARHLIDGAPTLLISELEVGQVKTGQFPNETLGISASNLSTNPRLVAEPPRIAIASSADTLELELLMGSAAGQTENQLTFNYRNLPVDSFARHLTVGGTTPVSGGTMDIATVGTLSSVDSNLPLSVTFKNTNLRIGGTMTPVASLTLPVAVRGPIDNPMVRVDSSALQKALLDAGQKEAVRQLQGEASKRLGIESGAEGESLEDTAKNVLGGFLKKKTEPKAEAKPDGE